jgi:hypothetical protein
VDVDRGVASARELRVQRARVVSADICPHYYSSYYTRFTNSFTTALLLALLQLNYSCVSCAFALRVQRARVVSAVALHRALIEP